MKLRDRIKLAWRCLRFGRPIINIRGDITITDAIDFGPDVALAILPGAKARFTHSCLLPDIRQLGGESEFTWCGCSADFPRVDLFGGKMVFPSRTDIDIVHLPDPPTIPGHATQMAAPRTGR